MVFLSARAIMMPLKQKEVSNMDNLEIVERIVEKTGVSYEDAKAALEATDWDPLNAVIQLEKDEKIEKKSGTYATESAEAESGDDEARKQISYGKNNSASGKKGTKSKVKKFFVKLKNILLNNKLIVRNNDGKEVINLPVIFAIVVLLLCFWLVVVAVLISLVAGCHYSFEGPELGKDSVNQAADSFGNLVKDIGQGIKEKCSRSKDEKDKDAVDRQETAE